MSVSPRFWIANRVNPWSIDLVFRVASAAVLSPASRHRYLYGGLDAKELDATLRRVRQLRGWSISWVRTAGEYLARARQARGLGNAADAAYSQATAALCYHFAQTFEHADLARRRHLYRRTATLFRSIAAQLSPPAKHVEIPWRRISLPGYLRLPCGQSRGHSLVVFLNGASTVKEEMTGWSEPFLRRGLATLALDTPGSGEAWERAFGHPYQLDIGPAILNFCGRYPGLDADRVGLIGISLRGAMAVQLAAAEHRFAAAISVTGPFQPAAYYDALNELVRSEIEFNSGATGRALAGLVDAMSLRDVAPRLRVPLLVVGAGQDLVVPPSESRALYQSAGGPKRLLFFDRANHAGFSHMGEWTNAAARWLVEAIPTSRR